MSVTLAQVAQAAGVSVSTASRALSNSDHPISQVTRERIIRLAADMDYQPNLVARSLRTDNTHTIGIIVENILSPFIPPIVRGIQDFLTPAGYFSIIINADQSPALEVDSIRALNNRQIDGIIFVAPWHRSPEEVGGMTRKPHVFVHRHFGSYCPNSVLADDRRGAHLAVSHLARLGHRRIAFISGPFDWDASHFRRLGYQEELACLGIEYDANLVIEGDWEVDSGYAAVGRLLALASPPTAIFAGNDLMALGVIRALVRAGRRVPGDVAVVGYDDRELAAYVEPAITTIRLPCYQMGQASAQVLLQMVKGEVTAKEPIEVMGELVVRDSCGARVAGHGQRSNEQTE